MNKEFIRLWVEEDLEELAKHLLIVGVSMGDCGNCRQLGLDYAKVTHCPQCKTDFRFITSRQAGGGSPERFRWLRQIRAKRPELRFVDYDDFEKNTARKKAKDIFS